VEVTDLNAVWGALIQRIRRERPLLAANVEKTALLEIKGENGIVGIEANDVLTFELLDAQTTRKFLDGVLSEAAGRELQIKFVKREGLVATPPPREVAPPPPAPKDPLEEFKNDPLIRKALEIFRAEIQPA
jgi:hypothetical protein